MLSQNHRAAAGGALALTALLAPLAGCKADDTEFAPVVQRVVAAGNGHTCNVRHDNVLTCWGWNSHGQLGDGSKNDSSAPLPVGAAAVWIDVTAGAHHSCAIRNDSWLWCWGSNEYGQLGTGTQDDQYVPLATNAGERWVSVSAGSTHSCAIRNDGSLWCWGDNRQGQIGNDDPGLNRSVLDPEQITDHADWRTVQTGDIHSCGLRADGSAWCWGSNDYGQLGTGSTDLQPVPAPVAGAATWLEIDAGYYHSCAIRNDHTMWCWGDNGYGQLGVGTMGAGNQRVEPVQVGADADWEQIALGDYHSCGRKADQTIWCWGNNSYGQLGDGAVEPEDKPAPSQVTFQNNWVHLTSGNDHSCALRDDESLWCWGRNDYGQLGDGTLDNRSQPVAVVF